jgi:phosphate-selective porin
LWWTLCVGVHIGLAVALPALAQESAAVPTEERLRRLEARVDSLQDANSALRRDLGAEGQAGQPVVTPGGNEEVLQLGGLLQIQGEFGDQGDSRFAANDRFHLRRARLNATGRFREAFDFKLEVDLAGTLGETSNLRAQVTDGYLNWNRHAFANVRLGQFKAPFGYEQLVSDPRVHTIERSLVNDRLTLGRQVGVQVSGQMLERRLGYSAGVFNGTSVNVSFNDNDHFLWAGRADAVPYQGRWGAYDVRWTVGSDANATRDANLGGLPADFGFDSIPGGAVDNVFTGDRIGWGVDSQVRIGSLDVWAEYLQAAFEPTNETPVSRLESDGAYVQAACFVVPARLQAVAKWDRFDPLRHVSGNTTQTWTLGLNYTIKGDDLKLLVDGLAVDQELLDEIEYKVLARAQVVF